jgi:hypothetical protein
LPNRHLDLSYKNFVVTISGDFGCRCRFEKQRESLDEIRSRFFNGRAVARNVKLWAQRDETIVFTLDNGG